MGDHLRVVHGGEHGAREEAGHHPHHPAGEVAVPGQDEDEEGQQRDDGGPLRDERSELGEHAAEHPIRKPGFRGDAAGEAADVADLMAPPR